MSSLRKLEMLKEIKRSELVHMAEQLLIEPHLYIHFVRREYPEIEVINDYLNKSIY